MIPIIKRRLKNLPYSIGATVSRLPFAWRPGIGRIYRTRRRELREFQRMPLEAKREFVFARVKRIVSYAESNIPFYKDYYSRREFESRSLRTFDDIVNIPIVSKAHLLQWDVENRSAQQPGRYLENTGGSSGNTLAFYVMPSAIPHEWAHMHHVWRKLGYRERDLKLCFGGRDLKGAPVKYDALRHHFAVSVYAPYEEIRVALRRILRRHCVRFLHGYPSALADFANYCRDKDPELGELLSQHLRGAFLSSEFPAPAFRRTIEDVFNIPSISWYGHSERAILAWEADAANIYVPFGSYGYAEAEVDKTTNKHKLLATCYYNEASPFIRYDTGDEVRPLRQRAGLLESFAVEAGREGDYILDQNGKRIPLTGLIFGRHHKIFEAARFVQISQARPGEATVIITPLGDITAQSAAEMFDRNGVDIVFRFRIVPEPFRTSAGKILLRVDPTQARQENR